MNAKEARALTVTRNNGDTCTALKNVYTRIRAAANDGENAVAIDVSCLDQPVINNVKKALNDDGFTVSHHFSYEQRDPYNYIKVSW